MTINVIPRWVDGPPAQFAPGQFLLYESGMWELVGSRGLVAEGRIVKHTTLIEPHELDWLQSMAVKRCLGELK